MAPSQQQFTFTDTRLANIERRISMERLAPYLRLANNDRKFAIKLYEWNTGLSESFYGILQGFEVALRNTFHEVLSDAFAPNDWYDAILLKRGEAINLQAAKERLTRDGKNLHAGGVVSELYFGFWVSLTGPKYSQTLWNAHLHRGFRIAMKRDKVHKTLSIIKNLRNRVAHHEIIIGRKLNEDYALIATAINWICPDTAKWIESNSTFLARYNARPQPPPQEPPDQEGAA